MGRQLRISSPSIEYCFEFKLHVVAHGDFKHFNNEIEKYAQKFLDGKLYYDYTEYSRQNWVLLSICCTLKDALALIIYYLLFKREDLDYLKKEYKNESTNN